MADILTDEQVWVIESMAKEGGLYGLWQSHVEKLIATLRHVQAENERLLLQVTHEELARNTVDKVRQEVQQENARLREALERIVKYYDSFDEDAEGFKQAMSDPYAIAQKALATEGSTE